MTTFHEVEEAYKKVQNAPSDVLHSKYYDEFVAISNRFHAEQYEADVRRARRDQ